MENKLKIETALKDAMRANNDVQKRTLRMVLSAIKLNEIEKGKPIDETTLTAILQKEVKSRKEAIEEAQKVNRQDLINDNLAEIHVLEEFLPKQLSTEDLNIMVQAAILETGAKGPADMGKVMKVLLPQIQGKAPNDVVSQSVRSFLLNNG